jgi:dTDP-4-amino-4,6-dideoxygalactose transaminase
MSATATGVMVPFIDLPQQFRGLKSEIDNALEPIFSSTSFILGPAVAQFEQDFAEYLDVKHCVSVHSGTAALHLALLALGIGPGDEVITVANTFIATAEGISFAGATPRFVDVDPLTQTMDVAALEAAITPAVKAIIPVHLFGQPADMDPIMAIAAKHGIAVVEDACQAHGARYKGRRVGTIGDVGCFSFYPGKNLGAAGEGGAISTNKPELADAVRLIRDHGSSRKYHHQIVGHNFRFDSIQAAVLNVKLPHLDKWNQLRREHAAYYTEQLAGVEQIVTPTVADGREPVFHLYVIETSMRNAVQEKLTAAGIQTGIHYPMPVHLQPAYASLGYKPGSLPVSEALSQRILSLPMYPELTKQQQEHVVRSLIQAVEK